MADEGVGSLPIFVVDAFTNKAFSGNPAAVCLLGSKVSSEREWITNEVDSFSCFDLKGVVMQLEW